MSHPDLKRTRHPNPGDSDITQHTTLPQFSRVQLQVDSTPRWGGCVVLVRAKGNVSYFTHAVSKDSVWCK